MSEQRFEKTICIVSLSKKEIASMLGLQESNLTDRQCQSFVDYFETDEDVYSHDQIEQAAEYAGISSCSVDDGLFKPLSDMEQQEVVALLQIAFPSWRVSSMNEDDIEIDAGDKKYRTMVGTDISNLEWGRAPWFNIGLVRGCVEVFEGGPRRTITEIVDSVVEAIRTDKHSQRWNRSTQNEKE